MSYLENKLLYKIYNEIYYYTFCIKTYYDRINISKEIDVNKTSESKECSIITTGIFKIKDLRFNHMYAIDATIY